MTQTPLGGLPYLLPRSIYSDPYGPNPLVTDLSMRSPGLFALASERSSAPTLFASGDLPPFTASGVDPQLLTGLPFHWRHAAASESDAATVLEWIEQAAQDRDAYGSGGSRPHPGLADYQVRMERWVAGLKEPDVELSAASYPEGWKSPRMRAAQA